MVEFGSRDLQKFARMRSITRLPNICGLCSLLSHLSFISIATMDRGAARSKKRAEKEAKAAAASSSKLDLLLGNKPERPQKERKEKKPRPVKQNRVDPNDPNRFKAKAVRTAHALIYSQEQFVIPPPPERLEGVTRIDLEGSGCSDVSWLPASTTWLSLKNCPVTEGWDTVGGLENLAVLNISGCGLEELPEELGRLANLKALVAVGNEWTTLNSAVGGWKLVNSLSTYPPQIHLDDDNHNSAHFEPFPRGRAQRLPFHNLSDSSIPATSIRSSADKQSSATRRTSPRCHQSSPNSNTSRS